VSLYHWKKSFDKSSERSNAEAMKRLKFCIYIDIRYRIKRARKSMPGEGQGPPFCVLPFCDEWTTKKIPKRVFNFSFDARLLKVFAHHGVYGEFLRMLNSAMCSQRVHISNVQLLRKRDRNGQVHPHAPWIFLPIHHFCTFCLDSWKSPYLDRRCLVVQLYSWCAPQTLSSLWLGKIWCPSQVSYPFIFAHPFQKMQVLKIVLLKSATVRWPCIASALRSLYPTLLSQPRFLSRSRQPSGVFQF
jgi:hypothetical protein